MESLRSEDRVTQGVTAGVDGGAHKGLTLVYTLLHKGLLQESTL
jgi:hypothetical protein